MKSWLTVCVVAAAVVYGLGRANSEKLGSDGTISFSAPSLDTEETHSSHMPQRLRCDACRAIAFQFKDYLSKAENKRTGKTQLSESEYIDTIEQCCSQKWDQYGLKEVNGMKRISGPGLEEEEKMGMVMLGGPWPGRLYKMCHSYLGEYEEADIYKAYRKNPHFLEEFLCFGKNGDCTKSGQIKKRKSSEKEL
ncbi:marginal zone B- and B1-cell-specific protein-like [Erpetoichthys calabaricus]|uniref:marginal zone B- and B1-cell-specific protein-like n=1 Tax=Erpetoichthys calabaricus TaxID=27687 RepID=UPI002234D272|nr:marginal zone B- and B1-cell-specific protein-like [Erpetoichthys calabaricus]